MGLELGAARLQKSGLGGKENSALWKSGVSANVADRSEQKWDLELSKEIINVS